jgi:oxygen-dependent protoporphyrinogen oxidase
MCRKQTIGIVGGGIAGLASAWQLKKLLPDSQVVIFEASDQLGGFLQTESVDGYLIETSADMFSIEPPTALEFCRQLGHADELIETQPVAQRAYIATPTGICPVPVGFSLMLPNDVAAVVESALLDEEGRARFLQEERVTPKTDAADESLQSFAVRRFGQQVFDRLIQPLVSGIYTADPQQLSMQATMNRFVKMEREYGSLIAAAKSRKSSSGQASTASISEQTASGARYDLFRAPQGGMGQLIDWLVDDLHQVQIRTGTRVNRVSRFASEWRLEVDRSLAFESFDAVVLATSASTSSNLMSQTDSLLAEELASIQAASCAIVVLGIDKIQLRQPFDGYGIVVPSYLNRKLIAASFSSNKFAGRAQPEKMLVRCFIGGALQADLVELPDDELIGIAVNELSQLLSFKCSPELTQIYRWPHAMPQYHVGHLEGVRRIKDRVRNQPGFEIAGNSYHGVGIPVCLKSGFDAAHRIAQHLAQAHV